MKQTFTLTTLIVAASVLCPGFLSTSALAQESTKLLEEVSFGRVRDEAEYEYLNNIGTNFNLTDEEVDRLISAAGKILRESPDFKKFIETNRQRP